MNTCAKTADNPYGFTGESRLAEADNLIFLRARYYDPAVGRLLSRDPLAYRDGTNLFLYVRNNPIIKIDPTGYKLVDWLPIVGSIINCVRAFRGVPGENINDYSNCFPKCPKPGDDERASCEKCVWLKTAAYMTNFAAGGTVVSFGEVLIGGLLIPTWPGKMAVIIVGGVGTVCGFDVISDIHKAAAEALKQCSQQ